MDTPPPPTPTSHFFTSLRTRLHYLDWGNPSAPTVILVHGGFDHAHSWDWTARALSHDHHVVALDLRGHGDSGWAADGCYPMANFVYDLALLVDLLDRPPVAIVGHSLGGSVTLRYAGLFPDKVRRVAAIEWLGMSPAAMREKAAKPAPERWLGWIAERREKAGRTLRRYPSIETAVGRMQQRNEHLSLEQALHLTSHGVNRNEDGSYSWKFDPCLSVMPPQEQVDEHLPEFWSRIACPTLLCLGKDSWASNPAKDGRMAHFQDARLIEFADAGHWLHHDQFDRFIGALGDFLRGETGNSGAIVGL